MGGQPPQGDMNKKLDKLKKQLLEECKRIVSLTVKRNKNRR